MTPQYGEAFVGEGANAAHINTVLGLRDGPVGQAWATSLATPSEGHTRFVVVRGPNDPVSPFTLFVNKATIDGERHAQLTWQAAQAGVADGVDAAVAAGTITGDLESLALIVAVWVDPNADDAELVRSNNASATALAISRGTGTLSSGASDTGF